MAILSRRYAGLAAASVLALSLVACSDDKDEAANTPAPAQTETATGDAAKTDTAQTDMAKTETPAANQASATDNTQTASTDTAKTTVEAPEPAGQVDMAKVLEPGPLPEMFIGDANAPVTIVEYMSMTCPHCREFDQKTFPAVKKEYVETGKVKFILREFPLDPRAAAAIMLARCAPAEQYFPMVDVLFKQQLVWATAQDARAELLNIARLAGFTQESFEACLTNQKLLDDVNAVRTKAAQDFSVDATPTFFIDGKRYPGDMSIEQMRAIIDPLLK